MVAEGEGLVKSDSQELRMWIEWDNSTADLNQTRNSCLGGECELPFSAPIAH